MYYFSITLVVIANVLYHLGQKSIPKTANPIVTLIIAYLISIAVCIIMLPLFPLKNSIVSELKQLNWAGYGVGIAIVGIELGFLLAYRAGGNISNSALTASISIALMLLPIGYFAYKENISATNIAGVLFCVIGLILVTRK